MEDEESTLLIKT